MKITKIEKQKKALNRYNIYLDDEYAFSVFDKTLIEFNLHCEKELKQLEIDRIISHNETEKCFQSALNYLSYRMHAEKELYQKLRKKYEIPRILTVLARLKDLCLIDDLKFAELWVESRSSSRGKKLLSLELYKKGITTNIIDSVLEKYCCSSEVEIEKAKVLVSRKYKNIQDMTKVDRYSKIGAFLARKGFEYNIISNILKDF